MATEEDVGAGVLRDGKVAEPDQKSSLWGVAIAVIVAVAAYVAFLAVTDQIPNLHLS